MSLPPWQPLGPRTSLASIRPPTWRRVDGTAYQPEVRQAHSFTLLHASEREAFAAQIAELGTETTLLVDTYDVFEAIKTGVELTNGQLGAVRLDSGDLGLLAAQARELLDSLGASRTKIIVTSDLDEFTLAGPGCCPGRRLRSRHRIGDRQSVTHERIRLQVGGTKRI
jgi:hypothetical protein